MQCGTFGEQLLEQLKTGSTDDFASESDAVQLAMTCDPWLDACIQLTLTDSCDTELPAARWRREDDVHHRANAIGVYESEVKSYKKFDRNARPVHRWQNYKDQSK